MVKIEVKCFGRMPYVGLRPSELKQEVKEESKSRAVAYEREVSHLQRLMVRNHTL
jgi:hypothetical protein